MKFRDGDIFRWRYNEQSYKNNKVSVSAGTLYWTDSCIGIWREDKQVLEDTYWLYDLSKYRYDAHHYTKEDVEKNMILTFVVNLNDIIKVGGKYEFNNYDDEDCFDLTHRNSSKDQYYVRKGAVVSVKKKEIVIKSHIKHYKQRIKTLQKDIEFLENCLTDLNENTFVPYDPKIYICEEGKC